MASSLGSRVNDSSKHMKTSCLGTFCLRQEDDPAGLSHSAVWAAHGKQATKSFPSHRPFPWLLWNIFINPYLPRRRRWGSIRVCPQHWYRGDCGGLVFWYPLTFKLEHFLPLGRKTPVLTYCPLPDSTHLKQCCRVFVHSRAEPFCSDCPGP